jgi:hypothetical protein
LKRLSLPGLIEEKKKLKYIRNEEGIIADTPGW